MDQPRRAANGNRPVPADELLPCAAQLIEAFRGMIGNVTAQQDVVELAAGLAGHHQRQWTAEDNSRISDEVHAVAAAKSLIDELNARRVAMVERIDSWAAVHIPARPESSLHTETLGSVIDRLAIAWVRSQRLLNTTGEIGRERARLALRQLAELADAYDDLVRDLAVGRRRVPAWHSLKTYGVNE